MPLKLFCGPKKPVRVCKYRRFRQGRLEWVRTHCRGLPGSRRK